MIGISEDSIKNSCRNTYRKSNIDVDFFYHDENEKLSTIIKNF